MVVPGLYGGRHLKGNDNYDRTKFMRSYYNNSAYQSDLEVGDIIIYYTSDASSIRAFLYLGDDGENASIITRFTISTSDKPLFFLINAYTTGISSTVLLNILKTTMEVKYGGKVEADEIGLPITDNNLVLPCGIYGRWEND